MRPPIRSSPLDNVCLSERSMDILEDELTLTMDDVCDKLGFRRDQMILQHDNGPKHTPNLVKKYFSKQVNKVVVERPPEPPNLNLIKNM